MPKAVSVQQTTRFDLQSLPEGFIVLRKMNYGEVLHRRELSQQLDLSDEGGRPQGRFRMDHDGVAAFEFSKCVVDHNLEDENGAKLNFASVADVMKLDSPVAGEIEDLIERVNQFNGEAVTTPLPSRSDESSELKAVKSE